jgi:hypothetical protein
MGGEASSPRHPPLYKLSLYIIFPLAIACCYIVALLFTPSKKHYLFSLHFVGARGALVAGLRGIPFSFQW